MIPSPSRPARIWLETLSSTQPPNQLKKLSIASWAGAAQVNSAWKNRNITTKKTIVPHTGWSSTLSIRSVRESRWGLGNQRWSARNLPTRQVLRWQWAAVPGRSQVCQSAMR